MEAVSRAVKEDGREGHQHKDAEDDVVLDGHNRLDHDAVVQVGVEILHHVDGAAGVLEALNSLHNYSIISRAKI